MVAIWRGAEPARQPSPVKRAVYTEKCHDDEGNRYEVIVWRALGQASTSYTLKDGTVVHYEDECIFRLPSGKLISRCDD